MAEFTYWPRTDEACAQMLSSYKAGPDNTWFENPPGTEQVDFEKVFKDAAALNEDALGEWFKLGVGLDGCYAESHSWDTFGLLLHVGELHFLYVLSEQQSNVIQSVDGYLSFETEPTEVGEWGSEQRRKYTALFDFTEKHIVCSEISKALIAKSKDPLVRALVYPVAGSGSLFVAICDAQIQWWGGACVLEYIDNEIVWQADWHEWVVEQSVYRVRAINNPNGDGYLIEVFGKTHMGNGSYYLFELVGRSLKNVLKAWAVLGH